jgi:cob(I)alamin adenosyltransferase
MRITKVYTRTGDKGKTRLAGGQQLWKDAVRVEAYGTVDELSAVIGIARAINSTSATRSDPSVHLEQQLRWVQNKLFDVGGILATAPGQTFKNMPKIIQKDVTQMEKWMDARQKELPPLKEFILPGGGRISSVLHQARTVCRRAERVCVRLAREEKIDPLIVPFLNRLGDALFVLARWAAKTQGELELLWERNLPAD